MTITGDRLRASGVLFGEGLEVTPMALFAGTFENRIDRKVSVSLPADFRAELPADGARVVYVYPSPRGTALEACDRGFMQRMSDSIEQFDIFSDEEDDMTADRRRRAADHDRYRRPDRLAAGIDRGSRDRGCRHICRSGPGSKFGITRRP